MPCDVFCCEMRISQKRHDRIITRSKPGGLKNAGEHVIPTCVQSRLEDMNSGYSTTKRGNVSRAFFGSTKIHIVLFELMLTKAGAGWPIKEFIQRLDPRSRKMRRVSEKTNSFLSRSSYSVRPNSCIMQVCQHCLLITRDVHHVFL